MGDPSLGTRGRPGSPPGRFSVRATAISGAERSRRMAETVTGWLRREIPEGSRQAQRASAVPAGQEFWGRKAPGRLKSRRDVSSGTSPLGLEE